MVSSSEAQRELAFRLQVDGSGEAPRLDVKMLIPPGISVLFGASGAGKSTCLAAVAGLIKPRSGHIALDGNVLFDAEARINVPAYARRIALVFQTLALFPHLSVTENVAYGLGRTLSAQEIQTRVSHWLERMRVSHVAGRYPGTLSGGEAQRVALARALASSPRALLLDEPFSALDSPLRRDLGREVAAIVNELSIPTLLVTHDRTDATELASQVVILEGGRVIRAGAAKELLNNSS